MSNLVDFKFHSMCKSFRLTDLIFADDLMVFCKGTMKSTNRVMEALTQFSEITDLKANMKNLSIFLAGMDEVIKSQILEGTNFFIGEFPIRYLVLSHSSKR